MVPTIFGHGMKIGTDQRQSDAILSTIARGTALIIVSKNDELAKLSSAI